MQERYIEVRWSDPSEILKAARSGRYRTGLDFLNAMFDGEIPRPPIGELLGYGPESFSEGRAVFSAEPGEQHYNPMGMVHGGVAATLLDTAMACAIHTQLPLSVGYTTLELKVNYIRPVTVGTGRIRAIGETSHLGKKTAVAEGRLVDENERLLALGSTTCLILS